MDIIEFLRYLNSADGPHMPLRAIAPYLGIPFERLGAYLRGEHVPKEETRKKMEKGARELIQEILGEGKWLL